MNCIWVKYFVLFKFRYEIEIRHVINFDYVSLE